MVILSLILLAFLMKNLFCVLIFVSSVSFGQVSGSDAQTNVSDMSGGGSMFRSFDNRNREVEGSPTVFEGHFPAVIYLLNGKTLVYPRVNYDVLANEIVVVKDGAEMALKASLVSNFLLVVDEDSVNFKRISLPSGARFAEELVQGDVRLYKVVVKTVQAPTNTGPYSSGSHNSKIVEKIEYYWQHTNKPVVLIENKKKLLSELQQTTGKDFSDFMKESKLSLKQSDDLKQLFYHVNKQLKG